MTNSLDYAGISQVSKLNEDITDESIPDPNPLPKPNGWNILVRPIPIRKKSQGGIILPDSIIHDRQYLVNVGRVLAIGPNAFERIDQTYNVGDYVVYSRTAGERFVCQGVMCLLMSDEAVRMTIETPEDLIPEEGFHKD